MGEIRKYPHNVLEGFGNGALLDLRVRFAMQMLTHSPMYSNGATTNPEDIASHALEVSRLLLDRAEEFGYIEPLPDLPEIDGALKDQAKRTAEYQASQQVHGNKVATKMMEDGAAVVQTPGKRIFGMQ